MIRSCVICGKQFEARGTATHCGGPHYKECAVCGKLFEWNYKQPKQCCSLKCSVNLRKMNIHQSIKVCKLCGKEFHPNSNTQIYCDSDHYNPCPMCGKPVKIDINSVDLVRCCSQACSNALRARTCMDRYGVAIASQSDAVRQKLHDAAILSENKRKQASLAVWGVDNPAKHSSIRKKISDTVKSKSCRAKIQSTNLQRYGVPYAMQSAELFTKQRKSQGSKNIASDGTAFDSQYELAVYEFFIQLSEPVTMERQIPIEYEYLGQQHTTYIDFSINGILFEVKGAHLMEGMYGDCPSVVPIEVKLDVYRKHHVVVVTDSKCKEMFGPPNSTISNGLKYIDKCLNPLIGIDIELFRFPEFPYASNRPKCFYDVRVDNHMSAHEAFYNLDIRWKMMHNRIMYSGGFIDNNQILRALNVTRTCKQPSWFSRSLAKKIMLEHCTANTIVDFCAGWGTRYDAAIELRKEYVGCDFNEELVKWHHECGRNSICWEDANKFIYVQSDCSVFICPPYSDPITGRCFEDYNFSGFDASASAKSQCDWLLLAMQNIPNANEYVMVCKIVDPGWEDYIVGTKENRSHFGVNYEYIVKVAQTERQQVISKFTKVN